MHQIGKKRLLLCVEYRLFEYIMKEKFILLDIFTQVYHDARSTEREILIKYFENNRRWHNLRGRRVSEISRLNSTIFVKRF